MLGSSGEAGYAPYSDSPPRDGRETGKVWRELAGPIYAAMAAIGCTALWQTEAMIEIMGVAVIPQGRRRIGSA